MVGHTREVCVGLIGTLTLCSACQSVPVPKDYLLTHGSTVAVGTVSIDDAAYVSLDHTLQPLSSGQAAARGAALGFGSAFAPTAGCVEEGGDELCLGVLVFSAMISPFTTLFGAAAGSDAPTIEEFSASLGVIDEQTAAIDFRAYFEESLSQRLSQVGTFEIVSAQDADLVIDVHIERVAYRDVLVIQPNLKLAMAAFIDITTNDGETVFSHGWHGVSSPVYVMELSKTEERRSNSESNSRLMIDRLADRIAIDLFRNNGPLFKAGCVELGALELPAATDGTTLTVIEKVDPETGEEIETIVASDMSLRCPPL